MPPADADRNLRRVLIVSPHFPPTNAPDCQRARMSLPYYREFGWQPEVLAVETRDAGLPRDWTFEKSLPSEVPVHRCRALPRSLTRWFGFGNLGYRSWWQLNHTGRELLRTGAFDLVYFSTTQFIAMTLGRRWLSDRRVPFVIDIQDPWRTDYYERPGSPPPPGGWKYRFARRQANRLEERTWRDAAGFTSVSPAYITQLTQRYPWFSERPAAVIPFGADPADFQHARQAYDAAPAIPLEPGTLCCASVGAIGPNMRESLEQLFTAVRTLRRQNPEAANRLRFHFVGTSYAPEGQSVPSVLPVAEAFGVADLVREQVKRVDYVAAIHTMLAADALIIPSSSDPAYNPSKIAGCFLTEKPVLVFAPVGSALEQVTRELGLGVVAPLSASATDQQTAGFLTALLTGEWSGILPARQEEKFTAEFTARARTGQQCRLFDRCLGSAPASA